MSRLAGQRVVLLNGPAGIGKTTVGRLMARSARNGVVIHGDELRKFVAARVTSEVRSGLSYVGGGALAEVYLDGGYELVVFEYVFERAAHVARFFDAFAAATPVHLVTLWAPLEVVIRREAARLSRAPLGDRVAECWRAMREELPRLGAVVDATPPADEVAEAVLRHTANQARLGSSELSAPT